VRFLKKTLSAKSSDARNARCLALQSHHASNCGGETRLIRSDILDRDMFDASAHTPENTAWTMQLLEKLDKPLGPE